MLSYKKIIDYSEDNENDFQFYYTLATLIQSIKKKCQNF